MGVPGGKTSRSKKQGACVAGAFYEFVGSWSSFLGRKNEIREMSKAIPDLLYRCPRDLALTRTLLQRLIVIGQSLFVATAARRSDGGQE
jgi:hypothetical protein